MAHVAWVWWVVTGLLLVAELMTGTFYLLMIAVGFAAGAVSLQAGLADGWQFVVAAAVAALALGALHALRRRARQRARSSGADSAGRPTGSDVNLDIGQRVYVDAWDGPRARAAYRGSEWNVELAQGSTASAGLPGWYLIHALDGITLIVTPAPLAAPATSTPPTTGSING